MGPGAQVTLAMKPDGILSQDEERKRRERRRRAVQRRKARTRWARRSLRRLRILLGFSRTPKGSAYTYAGDEAAAPVVEEDPELWERARPFAVGALVFIGVALGIVLVYGALARGPTPLQTPGVDALVSQTIRALRAGDVAGAREVRDQLARSRPDGLIAHYLDGHLLAAQRKSPEAAATAKQLMTLAGYREATGDPDGAAQALLQARQLAPNAPDIRLIRASLLLTQASYREVIAEADGLDELAGASVATAKLRGDAYLGLRRWAPARREYEAAAMREVSRPDIHLPLAEALMQLGEYAQARRAIDTVIRYHPDSPDAHLQLGVLHDRRGEVEQAEAAYREAIDVDPNHLKSLNNLAYLLCVRRGQPALAVPYAERAYKLAPLSGTVNDTLGWTYHILGRRDEALPLLRKAAEEKPDDAEVREHLAQAILADGRRESTAAQAGARD